MFRKLAEMFKPNSSASKSKDQMLTLVDKATLFSEDDEVTINAMVSNHKLEFFYINDYAKDIFLRTANIFSDDIVDIQSTVIDNATRKIEEILSTLTSLDASNFNIITVKEINLLSHYYRDEIYKYILILNKKKNEGLSYFKDYDLYIESGNRFVNQQEKLINNNVSDPLQKHINEENHRNIERLKEKIFKLKTNKLYHSQSLTQISIIHSISEKIYEQMNEIIFVVIPVLKNKSSITVSIGQINSIKNNLLSIKQDKDIKMQNAV